MSSRIKEIQTTTVKYKYSCGDLLASCVTYCLSYTVL